MIIEPAHLCTNLVPEHIIIWCSVMCLAWVHYQDICARSFTSILIKCEDRSRPEKKVVAVMQKCTLLNAQK